MSRLEFDLDRKSGVLCLVPKESLQSADFEALTEVVDSYVEDGGSLSGLAIDTGHFPGWNDISAFLAHMRFIRDHHKLIPRVAIISDDRLLSTMPGVADHFVSAKVRHFPTQERSQAMSWVAGNPA